MFWSWHWNIWLNRHQHNIWIVTCWTKSWRVLSKMDWVSTSKTPSHCQWEISSLSGLLQRHCWRSLSHGSVSDSQISCWQDDSGSYQSGWLFCICCLSGSSTFPTSWPCADIHYCIEGGTVLVWVKVVWTDSFSLTAPQYSICHLNLSTRDTIFRRQNSRPSARMPHFSRTWWFVVWDMPLPIFRQW